MIRSALLSVAALASFVGGVYLLCGPGWALLAAAAALFVLEWLFRP